MQMEMYTKNFCAFCMRAKQLAQARGIEVVEHNVEEDRAKLEEMRERTQGRTFPQIFLDGEYVGGFDQLMALDREGKLSKT